MTARTTHESDEALIERAVVDLAGPADSVVAFGGVARHGAVHITTIAGERTRSLRGLVVREHRGLGGQAMVEARPRLALDYRSSRAITHDYDRAVLGAGIVTLLAVPIVVAGHARGMLYCGSRHVAPSNAPTTRRALHVAHEVATELRIRDEVARRLTTVTNDATAPSLPPAAREEVRHSYAELRGIAAKIDDTALRERLARLERRWLALARDGGADRPELDATLAPREIDVLAHVARGETNAEAARALGLKDATVKTYLQSAMAKLGVGTRHAAVSRARAAGILP